MSNKVFLADEEMDYEELRKYFEELKVEKMNYDDFNKYFEFQSFREEVEEGLPGKGRVIDITAFFDPKPNGKILGHEGAVEISLNTGNISFDDFDEDHEYTDLGIVSDNVLNTLQSMYDSHSYKTY